MKPFGFFHQRVETKILRLCEIAILERENSGFFKNHLKLKKIPFELSDVCTSAFFCTVLGLYLATFVLVPYYGFCPIRLLTLRYRSSTSILQFKSLEFVYIQTQPYSEFVSIPFNLSRAMGNFSDLPSLLHR